MDIFSTKPMGLDERMQVIHAVDHLEHLFPDDLECILHCFSPYFKDRFVVILKSDARCIAEVLAALADRLPRRVKALCLRRSELFELSIPNFYMPVTIGLSLCLQHKSSVLFGVDLRSSIPLFGYTQDLLHQYLVFLRSHAINHTILPALMDDEYLELGKSLESEIASTILVALMAKQVWDVAPMDLVAALKKAYPDQRLSEILEEFFTLRATLATSATRRAAFRIAWLFEDFLHQMGTLCD